MDFKYIASVLSRFFLIVLVIVIIGNVMYHVVSDGVKKVETIETTNGSLTREVSAVATLVRKEQKLTDETDGVCSFTVSDGQRVSKNAKIADVYANTGKSKEIISRIDKLEAELGVLESAVNLESAYSVSSIEKKINEASLELSRASEEGDRVLCDLVSSQIRVYSAIKQLKSGHTDYKDEITALSRQISDAYSELGSPDSSIKSSVAGYFYSQCDGYEEIYGEMDLHTVTLEELLQINDGEISKSPGKTGKIVEEYTWYLLVPVSSSESMNYLAGRDYEVRFMQSGRTISMEVERVIRKTGQENAFLVLSYDKIPSDFLFTRYQRVSVCYEKFEGFRIPLSSVKSLDGFEGVYILHGNVIDFRRIKILAVEDAYALCDSSFTASDGKYKSLKYYDNIVVKGEELYVGKIIN